MKVKNQIPPITMNTTKKLISGLFAMAVLVLASCTSNSSDEVYDSVDKRYITKDNDGVDKRYITKDNDGAVDKRYITKDNESVDKRYITTGN